MSCVISSKKIWDTRIRAAWLAFIHTTATVAATNHTTKGGEE